MRIRRVYDPTVTAKQTQAVIALQYKQQGFLYESWDCEYWLVYVVEEGKVRVELFTERDKMVAYITDAYTRADVRVDVRHERLIISDARRIMTEQLSMFIDTNDDKSE